LSTTLGKNSDLILLNEILLFEEQNPLMKEENVKPSFELHIVEQYLNLLSFVLVKPVFENAR
jgi:hypothetical protein